MTACPEKKKKITVQNCSVLKGIIFNTLDSSVLLTVSIKAQS